MTEGRGPCIGVTKTRQLQTPLLMGQGQTIKLRASLQSNEIKFNLFTNSRK